MRLAQRVALAALVLAVSMVAMSPARAEIKLNGSLVNPRASMNFWLEGVENPASCPAIPMTPLPVGAQISRYCVGDIDPASNKVVAQARNDGASIATPVWAFGNASAGGGGNQIQAVPDSVVASVGLYTAPGGTALLPPPVGTGSPDSLLRVNIGRAGGTVTLSFPTINVGGVNVGAGGLQVRAVNPNETVISEFRLVVYNNQALADADTQTDGTGSAFFSRVKLETGAGLPTGGLVTQGSATAFTNADFIVQSHGGGKFTARPIAGLTRNVTVPDANAAVVVMFADPRSLERPVEVPSTTPIGLSLLALALMASGVWVISARRRAQAV